MRKKLGIVLAAVVVVGAAGAGVWMFARPTQSFIVVTGSVQVHDVQDSNCAGTYDGVTRDMQVQIADSTGRIVAFNSLGSPAVTKTQDAIGATVCTYPFQVRDVPKGLGSYVLMLGTHAVKTYHESELARSINLVSDGG